MPAVPAETPICPLIFAPDRDEAALPSTDSVEPNPVSPLQIKLVERSNLGFSTLPVGLHSQPSGAAGPVRDVYVNWPAQRVASL
jgi:hypothetical protein